MKLTINTDGGARGNPGPGALGVVVKNEAGEMVTSFSKYLGVVTNNQAEYEAVVAALAYLEENLDNFSDVEEVKFVLDSELVVKQLLRVYKLKSPELATLANVIFAKIDTLPFQINFFHTRRENNLEADLLVNRELDTQR